MLPIDRELEIQVYEDLEFLGEQVSREKSVSQPIIKQCGVALRRLISDGSSGLLQIVANARKAPLRIPTAVSQPYIDAAKQGLTAAYVCAGGNAFGATFRHLLFQRSFSQNIPSAPEVMPASLDDLPLKVSQFRKQEVIFAGLAVITRQQVMDYVNHRVGAVHFDHAEFVSPYVEDALYKARSMIKLSAREGMPIIAYREVDNAPTKFTYAPGEIDAVLLEFFSSVQWVINAPDVIALKKNIEKDIT